MADALRRGDSMSQADSSRINWTVVCVNEYAKRKALDVKAAFKYLHMFGGIQFLKEHYDAEHLLSLDDAVDDLSQVCQNNGGTI